MRHSESDGYDLEHVFTTKTSHCRHHSPSDELRFLPQPRHKID